MGSAGLALGDERVVEILRVAHGGHFVAHADGAMLLVRHALAGETVRVVVTDIGRRVVRADAIEVLVPSPDRVVPPCRHARPGGCGGCDFQHSSLAAQRRMKAEVLAGALRRFGGVQIDDADVVVEELPGPEGGLHWRTRMRWVVGPDGSLGLRAHRSHRIVPIDTCAIAAVGLDAGDLDIESGAVEPDDEVVVARGTDGRVAMAVNGAPVGKPARVRQRLGEREWKLRPTSFWQVHPALASAISDAVIELGEPCADQTWWDLYAGAGVLAASLANHVGEGGRVEAVEASADSVKEGRRALHDLTQLGLHEASVDAWLAADRPQPDGVVLDPPRAGAGRPVVDQLAARGIRRLVYVACDPVALGRDVGLLAAHGYRLDGLRAFDAFPMTHHLEAVARLVREER